MVFVAGETAFVSGEMLFVVGSTVFAMDGAVSLQNRQPAACLARRPRYVFAAFG